MSKVRILNYEVSLKMSSCSERYKVHQILLWQEYILSITSASFTIGNRVKKLQETKFPTVRIT